MSHPAPHSGSHRSRPKILRAVVPSLLAVIAVTAVLSALVVWLGSPVDDTARGETPQGVVTGGGNSVVEPSRSQPPTEPPVSTPEVSPTVQKSPSDRPSTEPPSAPRPTVVVFNQTSRNGLAAAFAVRLEAAGWRVRAVDNWRGTVPQTTVYYPRGERRAAQALAAAFAGVDRIHPRVSGMPVKDLTVILTNEFPG